MHALRLSVLSEFLHCWADHKLQHGQESALSALGKDQGKKKKRQGKKKKEKE